MNALVKAMDILLAVTVGGMLALAWAPPQQQEEKSCEDKVYDTIHHCIDEGGIYPQECFSKQVIELLDRCDYKEVDPEEFTC